MRREVGLEVGDEGRELADVAAERVDPLGRSLDVGGEHSLLPLCRVDLVAKPRDPPVQVRLPVGGGLAQGGGHAQHDEDAEKRC